MDSETSFLIDKTVEELIETAQALLKYKAKTNEKNFDELAHEMADLNSALAALPFTSKLYKEALKLPSKKHKYIEQAKKKAKEKC